MEHDLSLALSLDKVFSAGPEGRLFWGQGPSPFVAPSQRAGSRQEEGRDRWGQHSKAGLPVTRGSRESP